MKKIKVAIIGTGNIAQKVHIPQFSLSSACEVVAVCSRDKLKAESVARQFLIPQSFDSVDEMLAIAKPGIAVICTPNAFHFDIAMQSLRSGCHVFCEKPPAISSSQAREMADMSKKVNKMLAYNFNMRQQREALILKEQIDEGYFGNIYHINATFVRRRGIPGWGNFTNKQVQGGGALIDIGVHVLDLALHFLGYPRCKSAMAAVYDFIGKQGGFGLLGSWDNKHFTIEDSCFAQLRLVNKVSISLQTAFALNTKSQSTINIEVFGSKAGATLFPLQFFTEDENRLVDTTYTYKDDNNSQALSIQRFIELCSGHHTNLCTADEGAKLQEVVEMIYENASLE